MKEKDAIKKYLKTDKRILLEKVNDIGAYIVHKDKKPFFGLNGKLVFSEVHHIDEFKSPDVVTIYIED